VYNGDTVTCTLTFSGAGLSARLWDPLPNAMQYVTNSVTAPGFYSPTADAIIWTGTLPTNTNEMIQYQVTISDLRTSPLASTIVNTAWLTDTVYERSVSAADFLNGQNVYLPLVVRTK